jgi:hypothetical protein
MISSELGRDLSTQLLAIYDEAEKNMLGKVKNRVDKGITDSGWTELKSTEITKVRQELQKTVDKLSKMSNAELTKAIKDSYEAGQLSAETDLNLPTLIRSNVLPFPLQRLVLEANRVITQTSFVILRETNDAMRAIQAEVSSGVLTGIETRRQAAQRMLNRLADSGITGFVDKLGRNWNMSSYVEMATRTAVGNAALQGHIDRQSQAGRDLIVVSDHAGECPICRPWEGKVLSISGNTHGYPTLSEAKSQGLFHPNCRHNITGYIPGLTRLEPQANGGVPEQYAYTQKQRYNERQIRKWKRRAEVAMNPKDAEQAKLKIREYQMAQRELLKEYEGKFDMTLHRRRNAEALKVGKTGVDNSIKWTGLGGLPTTSEVPIVRINEKIVSHLATNQSNFINSQSGVYASDITDETRRILTDTLSDAIKNSELRVRVPDENTLHSILESGFKTQHEVGASRGLYNPTRRLESEKSLFGVDEHPVYGYLGNHGITDDLTHITSTDGLNRYGDIVVQFNKSFKDNSTTFTFGDSLKKFKNERMVPSTVTDVKLTTISTEDYDELRWHIKGFEESKPKIQDLADKASIGYVEAQLWQPKVSDIQLVVFKKKPSEELMSKLKELGIETKVL